MTGIRPEYDPRSLLEYIGQIRAADPTTPIRELDAYVRETSGGVHANVTALKRAAQGRGQAAAPSDATGMFSVQNEDTARNAPRTTGRNMARSALRGLTFNLDDNVARTFGMGTAPGGMYSPEGEADFRQYQQDHPIADVALGILGGAPVPLSAFGKVAKGAGLLARSKAGAQIGGVAGALSGAGDAESPTNNAVERVKGGLFGGAMGASGGAILPLAGAGVAAAGRKARRLVDGAYAGRQDVLGAVERMGAIGPDGLPSGKNARFYDDVGRERNLGVGMRRAAERMNEAELADRAQITPVGALSPELETMAVNTVRNNPGTAASGAVQDAVDIGAGSAARMQGDARMLRQATGQNPVAVQPTVTAAQMADDLNKRRGAAPSVPSPTTRGGLVPIATRNATERMDIMRENMASWADSPEGFAGLRQVKVVPIANEIKKPLAALDAIVMQNPSTPAAKAAAEAANAVRVLGDVDGMSVDAARDAIGTLSDNLRKGYTKLQDGTRIKFTTAQMDAMRNARQVVMTAVDAQTGGKFTPTMREYGQRNRLIEGVELGRELYSKRNSMTIEDMRSEIAKVSDQLPEVRDEVFEGMASDVVSKLRSAPTRSGSQNIVQKMVAEARSEGNKKLAMLFPSQKAFQDWMMRAYTMQASQEGAAFFTNTSVSDLSALMRGISRTASTSAERVALKKTFSDGLYARMQDQLNDPEQAATLVRQFADMGSNVARIKARMIFGKKGGDEFLRRAGIERDLTGFSNRVEVAARNPSDINSVRGDQAQLSGRNPVTIVGNTLGYVRTAAGKPIGRAASSAIADVLFTPGEKGMRNLQTLYQQDLAARRVRVPGLLPALGGQMGGRVGNGLMSILSPSPEEPPY